LTDKNFPYYGSFAGIKKEFCMTTIDIQTKVHTPDAPHPTSPHHTANGKFAPGNHLGGRKKRSEEQALLTAIDAACPPEELQRLLTDAITWAYEYKSPRMVLAIAAFVVGYRIGTPVRRSVSASGKLENILDRVSNMDEDEFAQVEAELRNR
jgi:hypothetical protein